MSGIGVSALEVWARRCILAALVVSICVLGYNELVIGLSRQPAAIDLAPIWTAGRLAVSIPHQIYDFAKVTANQQWLLHGGYGMRPFAYPPSTLLVIAPFSAMPFWTAYAAWMFLTGGFVLWAARGLAPERPWLTMLLTLLATPCFTVLLTGQTTWLVAGLVTLAVCKLGPRPVLAGALLAIAALIKPTTLILAPFALMAGGHWRALISAMMVGLAGALLSMAVFGIQPWFDWLQAVPRFQHLFDSNPGLLRGAITPSGEAVALGLHDGPLLAVRLTCVIIGAVIIWRVFKVSDDPVARLAAILGGGLLAAPYAMHYDGGLLAPAVGALAARTIDTPNWVRGVFGVVLLMGTGVPHMGAFATITLVPFIVWPVLGLPSFSTFLRREPSIITQ